MNKILFFFSFLISSFAFSQQLIRVFDAEDDFRVAKAKILTLDNKLIGITDQKGELVLEKYYSKIIVFQDGYDTKIVTIAQNKKEVDVKLESLYIQLEEVGLMSKSENLDAKKLIYDVILKQKNNDLSKTESYFFKSYTKYWSSINKDSIPIISNPKNQKDSLSNHWRNILEESYLFFGERAMDHKFSKKYGRKNIVQSSKISGVNSPIHEYLAIQPLALQFNRPTINFFFRDVINPLSAEGLEYYRFSIKEKIDFNNRPTTIVSFIPNQRLHENQFKGLIYIDDRTLGIAKFKAENYMSDDVAEIDADWQYKSGFWFPMKQKYVLDGGNFGYNVNANKENTEEDNRKEKIWINVEMTISNLKSPTMFKKKDFLGYENEIAFQNMEEPTWDNVMRNYRYQELNQIERNTYPVIDSVNGDIYATKNKMLRFLATGGKLNLGKVDLDVTKLLGFNNYEGLRLGLGLSTNEKFNKNFSLNGYTAYGFRDEAFKFGLGTDVYINKPYSGRLFFNYAQDVSASGRISNILQNSYNGFFSKTLGNIYNDQYFFYHKYTSGYEQDVFNNFTFNVAANYEKQSANFDYLYKGLDESYHLFNTELSLRWAPKDQFIRTPYGKVTLNKGTTNFYLTATKYWEVLDTDFNAFKINFSYYDIFQNYFGETNLNFNTGIIFGDLPIMNQFEGMGNGKSDGFPKNFQLAGISNFETMHAGEFYSSQYASIQIKHTFGGFNLLKKQIFPLFIYRGLIGKMEDKENHQNFNFNELNHYYQEGGVEFNNLFLNSLGLGFYYRFGAYELPKVKDNLFMKLTFRLNIF